MYMISLQTQLDGRFNTHLQSIYEDRQAIIWDKGTNFAEWDLVISSSAFI